jgi:multiple antibiotic resistance protein
MLDWPEYGKLLVALWALVHPLGAIPIFLSLTEHRPAERRHIGFVTSIAVGVILIACVFVGQALLLAFGIHIPSFRIAGGLLILFVALAMMQTSGHETQEALVNPSGSAPDNSVAIVPLAIPILAGPGAISTVIVYAHQSTALAHHLLICAIIVAVAASTFLVLRLAATIASLIGPTGMQVFTQIMGLLIAAIAVEFITQGLAAIFPGWG